MLYGSEPRDKHHGAPGLCECWPRCLEVLTAQRAAERAFVSPMSCALQAVWLGRATELKLIQLADNIQGSECDGSNSDFLESPGPRKQMLYGGDSAQNHCFLFPTWFFPKLLPISRPYVTFQLRKSHNLSGPPCHLL